MKKILLIIAVFALFSFGETKVSFSQTDIVTAQRNLQGLADYIDKSNLPHQDVIAIERTLKETYDLLNKGKIDSAKAK